MAAVVKWLVLVYLMFVTAAPPVTELLETVVRLLNDCSRFYPNTNQMRRSHEENSFVPFELTVRSFF